MKYTHTNRIFSFLLAVAMIFTLLPIAASAGTKDIAVTVSTPEDSLCVIGVTGYPTLNAAITDANQGDIIRFLKNYNHSGSIVIDKDLTFDLDGRKVNIVSTGTAITVSGAAFTIDDTDSNSELNVEGTVCGILVDGSSASATVTGAIATGTIEPIAALAKNGGEITITGNAIAANTGGIGAVTENGGTITIGGSVTGRTRGIAAHGAGSEITINGASVTADAVCVLADDGATVTVNADISSSTKNAYLVVAQNGGTVDVTGNLSADGAGSLGVLAEGNSEVTVNGDISATRYGVRSHSESHVTVNGNISVIGPDAMGAEADGGGILNIASDLTVSGANAIGIYATIYNAKPASVGMGGKLTISGAYVRAILCRGSYVVANGDLAVTGQDSIGIKAEFDGHVSIGGSVTASSGGTGSSTGVDCDSSQIEIVGSLTAPDASYIKLAGTNHLPAAGTPDPTHAGYLMYSSGTSKVWVGNENYPQVTTGAVSNVTVSGAELSGSVTSDGGSSVTERGFVYGLSAGPGIGTGTKVISGNGTGSFAETLSGLAANTTYHVRAYATNSNGTGYGEDREFTTMGVGGDPITPGVLGDPHDGVDFTALTTQGNGIYYGTYKHRLSSSSVESAATPILWLIMGVESSDADFITVMSRYVLDTMAFHSSWAAGDNEYNKSDIRNWLNNLGSYTSTGFLNSFSAQEQEGMGSPGTETGMYDSTGTEITGKPGKQTQSFPLTAALDKVYLPWGIYSNSLLYWTAGNNRTEGQIPEALRTTFWKDGALGQTWWLRTPHYADPAAAARVEAGGHMHNGNVGNEHEVRPVFKLDADNVIFTSEIGGTGAGATPVVAGEYAKATSGKNYKLTLLDSSLTLTGLQAAGQIVSITAHPTVSVASGGDIAIAGIPAAGTNITYKIVRDNGTSREIVGYGQGDGAGATVTAKDLSGNNLAFSNYTVYVWAQQNAAKSSNTGSTPQYFTMSVTDTTAPAIITVTPAQNDADVAISGNIIITFDETITKTGTVSLDHGIGTLTGTSSWSNGGKTYTIAYSGLAYNTGYTITIAGFEDAEGNPMANGSYSFTTLSAVPTAPQSFSGTPGDRQVYLTWSAPASDGGATIIGYEISSNNGGTWVTTSSNNAHTFTGLSNGQSYTFKVRAVNSVGNGAEATSSFTPAAARTTPSAPQSFTATPGNEQVALSWEAPASDGGATIIRYEVSSNNGGAWITSSSNTSHTFTGLTNGQSYTFKVRGVNSVGNGAEATLSATPSSGNSGGGGGTTVNAHITPKEAVFDKGNDNVNNKDVTVTLDSGSYSLSKILLGGKSLLKGTDYTVSGSIVTFKRAFLSTLEEGKHQFTFDMSGGADPVLTITITDKLKHDTGAHIPFEDVQANDWFVNSVMWACETGLMQGVSEKPMLFSPHGATTRGMIVTILYRLEGSPATDAANPFSDVAASKWYTTAVTWSAENKIVEGYGNGKFGPEDPITREQMAAILYRYATFKNYDVSMRDDFSRFTDAGSVSDWAKNAMSWANAAGLIQGDGAKLTPTANAERCQVAAIFQRFVENTVK